MNRFKIFNNQDFGQIRIVVVNGEPMFVGKDIAKALGYAKPQNAIAAHVDEDDSLKWGIIDQLGREQEAIVINESGMYSLILSSKLESAKKFKRWVTSEVLPSIRKTGAYVEPDLTRYYLDHPEQSPAFFQEQLNLRNQEIANLERQLGKTQDKLKSTRANYYAANRELKRMSPKVSYYEQVLQSPGTLLTTEIAKRYGMSASQLNQILHDLGIQFRLSNGVWVLYDNYANLGYTANRTVQGLDGNFYNETVWTQKGADFIHNLIKKY